MSRFLLILDDNRYTEHETYEHAVQVAEVDEAQGLAHDAAIIDTEDGTATQVFGDPDLHPFLDRVLTLAQHRFLVFMDYGQRPKFARAYPTLNEAQAHIAWQFDHHEAHAGHVFDVLDCKIAWRDDYQE